MSHDGSSAKSYIRHPTEKERLDNLAFASFPEDYLPYAAGPGHRVSAPPPYLLWGEDRRRKAKVRRRKPRCAGALLCAIVVVIVAILAVVAISVYLGVVTNLFRSPVVSISGRFISSDEFSDELLNATSPQFLEKAEAYQSKVEKAFLSSSLEPAFIAARVYSFRPGLLVFFRVYLDRRKLVPEENESPAVELVRSLISNKVTADPESVHVEENEELLSDELRPQDLPSSSTSKPTTQRSDHSTSKTLNSEGVGQWHPIPIEDSVSPSFVERPVGGIGSVRSPEESKNPALGSVRSLEDSPYRNIPLPPVPTEGIGSVRIIDESKPEKQESPANSGDGIGSVRVLEETSLKSQSPPNFQEGVGSVRLLDKISEKNPPLIVKQHEKTGSVHAVEETPVKTAGFPHLPKDGVGSVRLLDDPPRENSKFQNKFQSNVGLLTPSKNPIHRNPVERLGVIKAMEEPPTLAPSVSLVIRNRSRSDRPRNLISNSQKDQPNVGEGSIHEIKIEENFPLPLEKDAKEQPSKLFIGFNVTDNSRNTSRFILNKEVSESLIGVNPSHDIKEHGTLKNEKSTTEINENLKEDKFVNGNNITTSITIKPQQQNFRISSLGSLLFGTTVKAKGTTKSMRSEITSTTERIPLFSGTILDEIKFSENPSFDNLKTEVVSNENSASDKSDGEDIHASIVNHSQYPSPEPHYHTTENTHNVSIEEPFEIHTIKGHGFHRPSTPTVANTRVTTLSSIIKENAEILTATEKYFTEIKELQKELTVLQTTTESIKNESILQNTDLVHQDEPEAGNKTDVTGESWLGDDTSNTTMDDAPQQAKVVPQLKADFVSNDIGEEPDNADVNFEDEILRHITTPKPEQIGTVALLPSCPVGSMPCNVSGIGCGVRCDMRKDCQNNEDEQGCTCADLLRAMGQSQKICDTIDDCSDGSDEAECPWCSSVDHYKCPGSKTCISLENVCDGKDDCPGAQDERRCVSLAKSTAEANVFEYRSEGYLVVRRHGHWGKLCLDSITRSTDLDRRITELGRAVCAALTYRNTTFTIRSQDDAESNDSYYQISTDTSNKSSTSKSTSLFEPATCEAREVLRVQCQTLECGLRPSATSSQRRRIVGGKSAGGAGAWPWAVALYREGDFQCGAALINDKWLVSAAHCFYSSRGAFWSARLGVLRRGSELPSSGERVRRITDIILHPQYEDVGFINDIALLKMDRSVPYSDYLRPICLPSSSVEDASLWHGRRCSVVGWGKLYEIGHTFPDSLQEVRLPVISSAECLKRSLFLPAYRITPNMFCAGYDRGGRDACLGDSGGPMACQRPADSRWVLLGITSNGDGCGRPGRPGVYTQVAGFLSWIQDAISQDTELTGRTGSESVCKGIRCRLGRCIPPSRICDGKRDCAGGEDEEHCK